LEENGLGSINKEGLLKNELPKGDLGGTAAEVFKAISPLVRESVLLLPSSYKPYSTSFYSLKRTFL
jgi:hypothetical protein